MVQLLMLSLLQAAEYHNFGYFTSALAVNLLDRFMAAQPTSVSPKTLHPAMLSSTFHSISRALKHAWKGLGSANMLSTSTVLKFLIELSWSTMMLSEVCLFRTRSCGPCSLQRWLAYP